MGREELDYIKVSFGCIQDLNTSTSKETENSCCLDNECSRFVFKLLNERLHSR